MTAIESPHFRPSPFWCQDMTDWIKPTHTRGEVNRAGEQLAGDDYVSDAERDDSLAVISNWRSAHAYPLLATRMTLTARVKRVDDDAIVAQRLKRLTSIRGKLARFPKMQLARMQDVGGCRAVVRNAARLRELLQFTKRARRRAQAIAQSAATSGITSMSPSQTDIGVSTMSTGIAPGPPTWPPSMV